MSLKRQSFWCQNSQKVRYTKRGNLGEIQIPSIIYHLKEKDKKKDNL